MLYLVTVPIGELHTFWERSTKAYNGVLFKTFDYPLPIQWYVKDNCEMLNWIIISLIGFRFAKKYGNKLLIFVALLYMVWRIADVPLYWINYKTSGYGYVYIALALIGIVRLFIYLKWRK